MPEDVPAQYSPAELICRDGKWKTLKGNSEWSATGLYIFVRLNERYYVCKANLRIAGVGHIDLSHARPVDYAGEIRFANRKKRGLLRYWNNDSGHYKPLANAAHKALLPMEKFRQREG